MQGARPCVRCSALTVIVTHISELGIVHGADSNISDGHGKLVGHSEKIFPVPRLKAAVSVAGCYSVSGRPMSEWLKRKISADRSATLLALARVLTDALNSEASADERTIGYFLHLAGYASAEGHFHPEFYKIANLEIDAQTGEYHLLSHSLTFSEEFWSAHGHFAPSDLFAGGKGYIYCNGFPSGRTAYFALLRLMAQYRSTVWGNPNWSFRPPQNVQEEAAYLKLDMEQIGTLFRASDYPPVVGGPIETYAIPCP